MRKLRYSSRFKKDFKKYKARFSKGWSLKKDFEFTCIFPDEVKDAAFVKPIDNNDKCWRWSWDSYLKQKHLLVFKKVKKATLVDENGNQSKWNVYTKRYQKDAEEKGKVPPNYIDDCINSLGTSRLGDLSLDFSFSKPC